MIRPAVPGNRNDNILFNVDSVNNMILFRTALPDDFSSQFSSHNNNNTVPAERRYSDSDWSRVSSVNSLEWDNNVVQQQHSPDETGSPPISEVDTDTQYLLSEIERLTSKTLQETGQDLFS